MDNPSTSAVTSTTTSTAAAFGKRWRDKLRNKDKKSNTKLTVDEVVNDFLGSHRKNQDSVSSGTGALNSPSADASAHPLPKRPRRAGLKVTFNLGSPTVIGEGGEEAEFPTKYIGMNRTPQVQLQEPEELSDNGSSGEDNGLPSIAVNGSENNELGFDDNWRPPLTTDTTLLRALSSASTGGQRRSRLSMRLDDETAELARKVRAKMMEEEGRALHFKPPEMDEEAKEAAREMRRSLELASAAHESSNNIISPQPQRVVAYRPSKDYENSDEFEDERPPDNFNAPKGNNISGNHVQDMISHLRDQDDSMFDSSSMDPVDDDSPEHASGPNTVQAYKPSTEQGQDHSPTTPQDSQHAPALNPLDLSTAVRPRSRENDSPVSPIKGNGSSVGTPPGSRGKVDNSPSFSNLMKSPPQTQAYQPPSQRSPSPAPVRERSSPQAKSTPSKWLSTLSRANTTARPRPQPSSESSMSRSLSMRAGLRSKPRIPSDQPPPSSGWQKFQYQPRPSQPTPVNSKGPITQTQPSGNENSRLDAPLNRSPLPSPRPRMGSEENTPPVSQNSIGLALPQAPSKEPLGQTPAAQLPLASLGSSSSTATLPTYESATNLPLPDTTPKEAPSAKKSWRTLTAAVTRDALSDFSTSAEKYYSVFSSRAEDLPSITTLQDKKLVDWIRASAWWILKGRSQLETAIRHGPTGVELQQQGAVSLAKAWWINAEVVPNHAEFTRLKHQVANANGRSEGGELNVGTEVMLNLVKGLGDARLSSLITLHQAVSSHVRALATSMKRNDISLPPPDCLPRHIDLSIWERYPYVGSDVSALLATLVPKNLRVDQRTKMSDIDIGELMPFNDTPRFFTYGRMFVNAVLHSDDDDDDYANQEQGMPCVLSLTRDRSDWHVQAFIASQNNLVNVVIQTDQRQGPTWHDVRFDPRQCVALVRLSRGWKLEIKFTGSDAKMDFERLWKMVEYSRKVEAGLDCEENEFIAFESVLKTFQYVGPPGAAGMPFPSEPTQRCRIRVFEKQVPMAENGGTRFAHMGFRMICVTSPKVKNLSSLSHTFTHSAPIIFAHARSKDDGEDSPILLLRLTNRQTGASFQVRLTFHETNEMTKLHAILLNFWQQESEEKTPDIPMRTYSIEEPAMATRSNATFLPCLLAFPGQVNGPAGKPGVTVSVINTAKDLQEHGKSPAILSNSLRLFIKCGWGSVTDRMNLGMPPNLTRPIFLNDG